MAIKCNTKVVAAKPTVKKGPSIPLFWQMVEKLCFASLKPQTHYTSILTLASMYLLSSAVREPGYLDNIYVDNIHLDFINLDNI